LLMYVYIYIASEKITRRRWPGIRVADAVSGKA
jgi:hypothetical protein